MEVELQEIRDFIARCSPFDHLPAPVIDSLPRKCKQAYSRRQQTIPRQTGESGLFLLRKGAIELRDPQGHLLDQIAESQWFSFHCQEEDKVQAIALEDCLYLILPCDELNSLRQTYAEFDQYFHSNIIHRLRHALAMASEMDVRYAGGLERDIAPLLQQPPVHITSQTTIQAAAQHMTQHNISALLVVDDGSLKGIITDRDMRQRVIASGRNVSDPVSQIMTPNPVCIDKQQTLFDVALLMGRKGIQHLPVMDGGKLVGMLNASDLLRAQDHQDFYLIKQIKQAESVSQLEQLCLGLPRLQQQMLNSGSNSQQLGRVLAHISDNICRRLLALAEIEYGAAPVHYAWIACGSQARKEQTLSSDQDHMLILADDFISEQHDKYFQQLSRFVSDGLQACGIKYCPGESMALNRQWRKTLSQWQTCFQGWIEQPEIQSLRYASNFLDTRHIQGEEEYLRQLQGNILPRIKNNEIFLSKLATLATSHTPPLGFFRNLVLVHSGEHEDQLDLKLGGILPIVDLARFYALLVASPVQNTRQRLQQAMESGVLGSQLGEGLSQAHEFLTTLRASHQAEQAGRGEKLDNFIEPDKLSTLQRQQLKDAFRIIKQAQDALTHRYSNGYLD